MRIGIDVDEVVADLHTPWLRWGNARFGTSHQEFAYWDAPTDWWGKEAYDFLTPEIYHDGTVRPYRGAEESLRLLTALGHTIIFVTSCAPGTEAAKRYWLLSNFGPVGGFISTSRKGEVLGLDLLVDDGFHNVAAVGSSRGILVTRSHNRRMEWPGRRIRGLQDLPALL